jgi:alanine racemase
VSNSAAALRRPDLSLDLVRPGIFLYGGDAGEGLPEPEEVVAVRARIVLVKDVPAGTTLGYGSTYASTRAERWATLGIGYGDGLPRALGNRGSAVVRGQRVPIVGRISMDLTVVDVTDLPGPEATPGEIATLIGSDGKGRIPLEEAAALAGTIGYEVLTGLTSRLPRVWMG